MGLSTRQRIQERLIGNKVAIAGGVFLVLVIAVALFAPVLAPHSENQATRFQDILFGPSGEYWLGTDHVGRDIASRLMFGARYALFAGTEAVLVALMIGIPLGLILGYFRGWIDAIFMRVVEVVVAIPAIVMAMAIIAGLGSGLVKAMLAIGFVYSMVIARLLRAEVLAARKELYVDGAIAAGASSVRVMVRHVLPNVAPTLIVQTTLLFAQAILAEAGLSFLGIGAGSDQASWGRMLRDAQQSIDRTIWPALPPGLAVFATVVAFNVFGDGLRDAFSREARSGRVGLGDEQLHSRGRAPGDAAPSDVDPSSLLSVRGLSVTFPRPGTNDDFEVVRNVDIDIGHGEILALVGESGSGKSITALSIMGMVPDSGRVSSSSIVFNGVQLVDLSFGQLSRIRGTQMGVIFQEPFAALNPAHTVGRQVGESLRYHLGMSRGEARSRTLELLAEVGIPDPKSRIDSYPHQFSGGMAQRVVAAMALACEPKLLIADEPTTALDVTVQGQLLDLIGNLARERNMSVLLITHDLGVVADLADRVAVMYAGQVVETGRLERVFTSPQHPYTEGLIRAIPRNARRTGSLPTIPGVVPSPWNWSSHCVFVDRCEYAADICRERPAVMVSSDIGASRCLRTGQLDLRGVRSEVMP